MARRCPLKSPQCHPFPTPCKAWSIPPTTASVCSAAMRWAAPLSPTGFISRPWSLVRNSRQEQDCSSELEKETVMDVINSLLILQCGKHYAVRLLMHSEGLLEQNSDVQSNVVNVNDNRSNAGVASATGLLLPLALNLKILGILREMRGAGLSSPLETTECCWHAEVVLSPHTLSFLDDLRKEGETAVFSVDSALFSCTSDCVLFSAFSSKQHPSKYPCHSKRSWSNFGVGRCGSRCAERKWPGIQTGMDSG